MMIREYQVKCLFGKQGVPLLKGEVAYTPAEAQAAAERIGGTAWVVKAQVPAEDRSRSYFAGQATDGLTGICWANTTHGVADLAEQMLDKRLITPHNPDGYVVKRVYVEEACLGQAEYRLSLRTDFTTQQVLLCVCSAGNIMYQYQVPEAKLTASLIKKVIQNMHLKGNRVKEMRALLHHLSSLFSLYQAVAVEFDPVWETANGFVVLDGRIIFDDDTLFRQPDIAPLYETDQKQQEIVRQNQFRYEQMKGNIACLVNGIGLSQATVDLIRQNGGQVACLLDVGTEPSRDSVARALKLALSDPNADGILVNIFGGVTRCDIIVQGLLATAGEILAGLPVVVRMDGTNAHIGRRLLFESRLPFTVVKGLSDAVSEIIRQVKETS